MKCPARAALIGSLLLSGCNLAPVYKPPHFLLPDSYQGTPPFEVAHPDQELAPRGDWWTLFNDPELTQLEARAAKENPTLQAAAEQYMQARDLAAEAQSALYPVVSASAEVSDNRQSQQRLFRGNTMTPNVEASNEILGTASWEPDFWDEIRNRAHQQKRLAQAGAADLETARLSLQAELATDYFAIRGLDSEAVALRASIAAYKQAVLVTRLRYHGGIGSGLDLARASSQLGNAEAQLSDTALQRDLLQHALAVLIGAMPSTFTLAPRDDGAPAPPGIPLGLPAELLQRRPDVASAERHMAAANAAIGVSRAAFYPNVTFFGNAGYQGNSWHFLNLPETLWSVGSQATLPLFEGGLRRAELQRSWSAYAQTRDNYRATVLAAFQEVEDGLSLTQRLESEVKQQHEASQQAREALAISTKLYEDGLDNYLSVSVAQVAQLAARTAEIQVQTRQMQAAVTLIRAIGGGWTEQKLPTEKQVIPFGPLDYAIPRPQTN
jgi:outer membrane protein, multidrug efflux system